MPERLNYSKAFPEGIHAILNLEKAIRSSGLEPSLLELVKTRATQMNGCPLCIDMHTEDVRAAGETEQRLYALSAWEETPFYTPRERAALARTEAITTIQQGHAPDAVYEEAVRKFSAAELGKLTLAVAHINTWNRIAIAIRRTGNLSTAAKSTIVNLRGATTADYPALMEAEQDRRVMPATTYSR